MNNKGKNNPSYKDGRTLKKYYCIDCKKEIYYGSIRCSSCATKHQIKTKGNPFLGKKHKKLIKIRISETKHNYYKNHKSPNYKGGKPKCVDCEKQLAKYGAIRCEKCYHKFAIGKNAPNYIHGEAYLPYNPKFNKKLKAKIRKRDNYTCQNCSMTEAEHIIIYGTNLTIHHIDYDKQNCKEENLIALCNQCNLKANSNREYWETYFKERV